MSQNQVRAIPAIEIIPLAKIILIIFLVVLAFSQSTDADVFDQEIISGHRWQATTLEFSQLNTANNTPTSALFNISRFLPGGFEVRAVRIKKEGQMNFNYRFWVERTAGYEPFCRSLELTVMRDWQIYFQGFLVDLSLEDSLDFEGSLGDWVFFVHFNNPDSSLKEKNCDFDFVFRTFRNDFQESGGFFDEGRLNNHVVAGNWADG